MYKNESSTAGHGTKKVKKVQTRHVLFALLPDSMMHELHRMSVLEVRIALASMQAPNVREGRREDDPPLTMKAKGKSARLFY